jgi:magnesium chelatase subunit D
VTESDWPDPVLAAAILAVAPAGLGVRLRMRAGPARDSWLSLLRGLLPPDCSVRRCPPSIADDRLLGGLDLAATLATGRRVANAGLLAETDGGLLILPMAERASQGLAARLGSVLETAEVVLERDGIAARVPASLGLVALDEGTEDDPPLPSSLLDRLAMSLSPDEGVPVLEPDGLAGTVADARDRLARVEVPDAVIDAICRTSLLAGIDSIRGPLLALRVARIVAALHGHDAVTDQDASVAARLVLAPRATMLPEPPTEAPAPPEPPEPPESAGDDADQPDPDPDRPDDSEPEPPPSEEPEQPEAGPDESDQEERAGDTADTVLQAVRAALPPDLLTRLRSASGAQALVPSANSGGRIEAKQLSRRVVPVRGRPIGTRPGDPARGRLNVLATLRAALPWQKIRQAQVQAQVSAGAAAASGASLIRVRREDFRLTRFAPRVRLTTIFVVDASGSSARARLAEAKGCVEMLLADCYARRDQVALVAFRGQAGELVLPPTGSVARARRALDGLPGGGGTPLAAGLETALTLVDQLHRAGEPSMLVLLTDARANVARDGTASRELASRDALEFATRIRIAGLPALLVDISARAGDRAAELAATMGARYLLLPQADAETLTRAVRASLPI